MMGLGYPGPGCIAFNLLMVSILRISAPGLVAAIYEALAMSMD
jgi:hypothetical protein